jgi:hypothetical protein
MMKVHIQLSDNLAEKLLEEGLVGLPADFADTIRRTGTKRSELIKLVIQRHLAKLEEPSVVFGQGDITGTAAFDTSDVEDDA